MRSNEYFRMIVLLLSILWVVAAQLARGIQRIHQRAHWRCRGVRVGANVNIRSHSKDSICLKKGVSVGMGSILLATVEGSELPTDESGLVVGERTAINEYSNIRACGGRIEIGNDCLIAQMVSIIGSNHGLKLGELMIKQPWSESPRSVYIGDDVWIGAGVTVLPGARIGNGVVIAAGAVVRGVVPDFEIWGGIPAKKIGSRI
jgi:acetyltransferase-like isoleucine patch superfamily enzyme